MIITGVSQTGDDVHASGTVDGIQATAHTWASHLSTLPDTATRQQYLAQQLAAAVPQRQALALTGVVIASARSIPAPVQLPESIPG